MEIYQKIVTEELPDFDLMNFSFPCTDISVAGQQAGMSKEDGSITRSGLYVYGMNVIKTKKPKYVMIENVKNLVGKKFKLEFDGIVQDLQDNNYNVYWRVLNAKDFGIPQNRERVYAICIRRDIDDGKFNFPEPSDDGTRLKDILDQTVEDKYYISQERTEKLLEQLSSKTVGINPCLTPDRVNKRQMGRRFKEDGDPAFTINTQDRHGILTVGQISNEGSQAGKVYHPNGVFPTVCACTHGYAIGNILELNDILESDAKLPILHNIYGGFKEKEPRIFNDYSPTIRTSAGGGHIPSVCTTDENKVEKVIGEYKIRKLTPRECWRLMGFCDEDFDKARDSGISDSQLYKQAGNSIVVNVLELIFKNLFNK